MPENDVPSDTQATPIVIPMTPKRTPGYRSAITTAPDARLDGNSIVGRRIRDIYRALMERLNQPADIVIQSDVLALAELKTMAEAARLRVLEGKEQSSNEIVRLENLVRRAEARVGLELGAATKTEPETLEQYLARTAVDTDDGEIDELTDNEQTP
jgi:hypothetical protein